MKKTTVQIEITSECGAHKTFRKLSDFKTFVKFCDEHWDDGFYSGDMGYYLDRDKSFMTVKVNNEIILNVCLNTLPKKQFSKYNTIRKKQAGYEIFIEENSVVTKFEFDIDGEFNADKLILPIVNWRGEEFIYTEFVNYDGREHYCDESYNEDGISASEAWLYNSDGEITNTHDEETIQDELNSFFH